MANFNKVLLMGNLTRDPEVRYTPKGTAVGDLGLAINDSYKAQDGTIKEVVTYVDIEVWGRQAETCKQYLTKGRPVFVEGQLKLDQWEQDGQKKSRLKVRADRVQFLGSPSGGGVRPVGSPGGGGEQRSSPSGPGDSGRTAARSASTVSEDAPPAPSDDDIPF
jgi:single-strand DNA-binding protein